MNRTKYRVCLMVVLIAAIGIGIVYYVNQKKETPPYSGASLVHQEYIGPIWQDEPAEYSPTIGVDL